MDKDNAVETQDFPQDFIQFEDITFVYPPTDEEALQEEAAPTPIFQHFTASLPGGFVSLVGPNASGKSTFMLLAAGRLLPQRGRILLLGQDTRDLAEEERSQLASFIYQNMEFDTKDKVAQLLQQVYSSGLFSGSCQPVKEVLLGKKPFEGAEDGLTKEVPTSKDLLEQVIHVLELEELGEKSLRTLSKGQMQRVILAFSLLYGSRSIFMDEPLFALENRQKHRILGFIKSYCRDFGVTVYISMHELELTRLYPDSVLLFYPNRDMDFGTPQEVLVPAALEKAYGVPVAMLKDAERLTRRNLQEQYQDSET